MAKTAIIYTSNTCGQCKQLKKLFKLRSIAYNEFNVDDDPKYHDEVKKLSGQLRVPVTVIDERVVVGYNPTALLAN